MSNKNKTKYYIWFANVAFLVILTWLGVKKIRISSIFPHTININNAISKENLIPIAVIGSGPAGLMAAVYGARAKIGTVVIEGNKPGGLLTETSYVENWPGTISILGKGIIENLKEQASHFGAQFLSDTVDRVNFNQWPFILYTKNGKKLYALSVIIATGATSRLLGVPGEQEYWGTGITACAIYDAPFFQGKDVVVVGGGDSAVEEALQLVPYARTITILVRKSYMRAAASMQERLHAYLKINVQYNVSVQKILGDGSKVTGLELLDNQTNKTTEISTNGVFLAIGHDPNTALFGNNNNIDMNKAGYICLVNRSQKTSKPGIFAAGDATDWQYRQAGVASGDGIKAALDAVLFLNKVGFNTIIAQQIESNMFIAECTKTGDNICQIDSIVEFGRIIKKDSGFVAVDFYADYCPFCIRMRPVVNAIAQQFIDKVLFVRVNVGISDELAKKWFIHKVPCLLIFHNGQLVARYNKVMSKKKLLLLMQQLLNSGR